MTVRSVLKANIPFFGGKAEDAAAGPIRAAIAKEEELGQGVAGPRACPLV